MSRSLLPPAARRRLRRLARGAGGKQEAEHVGRVSHPREPEARNGLGSPPGHTASLWVTAPTRPASPGNWLAGLFSAPGPLEVGRWMGLRLAFVPRESHALEESGEERTL